MMKKFIYIAIIVCLASLANAGTYYVSQSGNGDGDGTSYADRASVAYHNAGTGVFASPGGNDIYLCGSITTSINARSGSSGNITRYRLDYATDPGSIDHNNLWYEAGFDCSGKSYITLYGGSDPESKPIIDGQQTVGADCTDDDCLTNPPGSVGLWVDSSSSLIKAIDLDNADHIIIDNVKIQNSLKGISATGASYITVTRCHFYQHAKAGVNFTGSDHITIGGSEVNGNKFEKCSFKHTRATNIPSGDFYGQQNADLIISYNEMLGVEGKPYSGWGGGGILAYGTNRLVAEYNSIHDHGGAGFRAAIHLKGQWVGYSEDNIVRFNHMYAGPASGSAAVSNWCYGNSEGITITKAADNFVVYGNRVNNYDIGIFIMDSWALNTDCTNGTTTENVYVFANEFSNLRDGGILVGHGTADCTNDLNNLNFWNNTVYKTYNEESYYTGLTVFFHPESFDDGTYSNPVARFINNIISEARDGLSPKFQFSSWYDNLNGSESHLLIEDNLWFDSDESGDFNVYFHFESFCHGTVCAYSDKLINDIPDDWFTDATIDNPDFTDADNGDLTLTAVSPGIDNGAEITIIPADVSFPFYSANLIEFDPNKIMHPTNTDWSSHPPVVELVDNSSYGSGYEQGAYVYVAGGSDTTNPTVTITSPASAQTVYADSISFTWTCSDANGVSTAKWRIGSAPDESNGTVVSGSSPFTATISGLSAGANSVYVGCDDPSDNWGSDSETITYTAGGASGGATLNGVAGIVRNGVSGMIVNGAGE